MASERMRRVDEAIREVLSEALAAGLKDPRIGFVTVTSVDTSPDLRQSRVYVSVLGDERARDDTLDGLGSAAGFLQREIGGALRLRRTPALSFHYDDSVDRGMRIGDLLARDEGKLARDEPEQAPDDAKQARDEPEQAPDDAKQAR
jgi:ribosome-binding factor A